MQWMPTHKRATGRAYAHSPISWSGARARGALAYLAIILLLALALVTSPAEAGIWTSFTTSNGLPADGITALAPSNSGTILIATAERVGEQDFVTLVEYDGVTFDTLTSRYATPPDFTGLLSGDVGLPGANIVAIAEHPDGSVWVATNFNGVFQLGDNDYQHYTEFDGLGDRRSRNVSSLIIQSDGIVWAGMTSAGLSRFDGALWTTYTSTDGLRSDNVSDLALAGDGRLWLTLSESTGMGGLTRFDGATFASFQRPGGGLANSLSNLAIDPAGNIWVTSAVGAGVFAPDGSWLRDFTTADGLATNSLRDVETGPHGDVWVGSFVGLQRWDGADWTVLTQANSGLISNSASPLKRDFSGALWVGTPFGLSRNEGSKWLNLSESHGLIGLSVNQLSRDPSPLPGPAPQTGLIGSPVYAALEIFPPNPLRKEGLVRISGFRADTVLTEFGALLAGEFKSVSAYPGGAWAAYRDSLLRVEGIQAVERFGKPPGMTQFHNIVSVLALPDTTAWAGSGRVGISGAMLLRYEEGAGRVFNVPGFTPASDQLFVHTFDSQGRLWVSSPPNLGAARVDTSNGNYNGFSTAEGLPSNSVKDIVVAQNGDVWFGTDAGVSVLRGTVVQAVPSRGLPSTNVLSLGEDQDGRIWAGTEAGVAYFNGTTWTGFRVPDGLAGDQVNTIVADTSGTIIGTQADGISLFKPDRVSPRAVIEFGPPALIGVRSFPVVFTGGDLGSRNEFVELSWSLDGAPRRPFSKNQNVTLDDLADGPHTFEIWARDRALNESTPPTMSLFEVDATPPQPLLSSPTFGQAVNGDVEIRGNAAEPRFERYTVLIRETGAVWDTIVTSAELPVAGDPLATWNTRVHADGVHELALTVTDTLGLVGYATVEVIVDNEEPNNDVTSPARVNAATGGRVFTLNGEVEAYFPPQALDQDRIVTINQLQPLTSLPPGASRSLGTWQFQPFNFDSKKPVTLTFALTKLDSASKANGGPGLDINALQNASKATQSTITLGLFGIAPDSTFDFLGGSLDAANNTLTTTIWKLGTVGVYQGLFAAPGQTQSRDIQIQPRAFSPTGSTFDDRAAISFNLNTGGNVQVYAYDRAGRLVRRVHDGSLGPGRNVVYWDGRDGNGRIAPSGLYIVMIKAEGSTDTKSVAVVNR